MKRFFEQPQTISRFLFACIDLRMPTSVPPEEGESRQKEIERICAAKSAAASTLMRETHDESVKDKISSNDNLSLLFRWLSELEKTCWHAQVLQASIFCWNKLMQFLLQHRFLEICLFFQKNPTILRFLARSTSIPLVSSFLENCVKMESSLLQYPQILWSNSILPVAIPQLSLHAKQGETEKFLQLTLFVNSLLTQFGTTQKWFVEQTATSVNLASCLVTNLRFPEAFDLAVTILRLSKQNSISDSKVVFLEFLCHQQTQQQLLSNFEQPFGRLHVVELASSALEHPLSSVEISLTKSGLLANCLDQLFVHKWSNVLHCSVTKIITQILQQGSHKLKYWLIAHYKLLERLLEKRSEDSGVNGFQGHILQILTAIWHAKEKSSQKGSFFNEQLVQYIEHNFKWEEVKEWIIKKTEEQKPWEKPRALPIQLIMSQLTNMLGNYKKNLNN